MSGRQILKDSTNVSTVIRIIDSGDGTPETGVTSATAGLALEYRREGAASVAITESDLSALTDAHSDGGMLHIGNGYYRVDIPDAAFATGADGVLIHGTATGMVVIGTYHPLISFDLDTALPSNFSSLNIDGSGLIALQTVDSRVIRNNTCQAGTTAQATLDASASSVDDAYKDQLFYVYGGTGAFEAAVPISSYDGTTKVAVFSEPRQTAPDNTSSFAIILTHVHPVNDIADAVLDRDASSHTTNSTLGGIVNDLEDAGRLDAILDTVADDVGKIPRSSTAIADGGTATYTNADSGDTADVSITTT